MTSTAQVEANRSNAQKSTGPRTPEGKAVAAQNAVRHGLLAKEVVVKGEDPGEFECYREQMLAELAPVGLLEEMLAQRIVGLPWRLRRAERLQALAYDKIEDKSERPQRVMDPADAEWLIARMLERGMTYADLPHPAPGCRAAQDFNQERVLDRLLVYERRIEHSLYRTMAELRKERLLRQAAGGLPRSTGILPVSSMGVPPMTVGDTHGQACSEPAEGDGCDTHGQACPELAEGDARAAHGRDAHATEPEGGTPNGGGDESCETNPIPETDSAPKKTPAEPPRPRMYPNTAREMTYDFGLRRWVWTGYALANKDSKPADAGRRQ